MVHLSINIKVERKYFRKYYPTPTHAPLPVYFGPKQYGFKVAPVVEIASFDPPKKQIVSFFLGYSAFVLKYRVYHRRIRRFDQKIICASS